MIISKNTLSTLQQIRKYEQQYNRTPNSVTLLGACKKQSAEKIVEAFEAGLTCFGGSYLQEALEQMEFIPPDMLVKMEWHFIGHIQRNKTRKIAEHFAWVHSVDNIEIAKRLSEQRPEHLPPLNICIEVNISHETSKSGIEAKELETLAKACASLPHINLRGLMSIPAPAETIEQQRAQFKQLASLKKHLVEQGLSLDTLSMGMSEDYEAAIAEGSTIVRIGTALFGARG